MSCLSSCKKIALAYSPCQTRRIIKWLAIGLSQSSYRFYSMLATFALKDYRLVAPNRAKSLELSFYTVDDAMLVELQSKLGFGNSGCCLRNLMFSFDNFKIMLAATRAATLIAADIAVITTDAATYYYTTA
ncbi:hypothetical protein POTOM_019391 [Populus tomentosa]|uniref:Uncharacterized protein n=1 Tax=Populus tomentosa TaxID=118781 RepID=A0A8X7ZX73_POPTO|nr:hypothetical protein POTOM_019391 [Populus tomentosa]